VESETNERVTAPTLVPEPAHEAAKGEPSRRAIPADEEERRSFRRAMLIGLFVWPAFHFVDHYLGRVVYPGAPMLLFFGFRVIGEAAIFGMYRLSFKPDVSSFTLKIANVAVCGLAAIFISIMGVSFGGLTSPYLHGVAIVILVLALAVPAPWRDTIGYVAACALSYPSVILIAAQFRPDLAQKLQSPQEIALFFAHYLILLGSAIVATVGSQVTWNARQELRRARRLGRYRLEARIGEGGMNQVWLAWDESLRRNVALKILRSSGDQADPRALARFEREAMALSRLTSANTVRVFDFAAADDGFSFIAMEYLAGKDLQALVETDGPLPAERAVRLALQACRSLQEAHRAGIVHRDVKPANLFVTTGPDGRDQLKVLDFGIARLATGDDDATKTQSVRGTPAYMAPESWAGGAADAQSDIYALGATLYFTIVGRAPFDDRAAADLVRAHLVEPARAPSLLAQLYVPESLDDLVLRCLAKEPKARFADAEELADALSDCLDEMLRSDRA
jgi:predicted Ser/Thr protein kinase